MGGFWMNKFNDTIDSALKIKKLVETIQQKDLTIRSLKEQMNLKIDITNLKEIMNTEVYKELDSQAAELEELLVGAINYFENFDDETGEIPEMIKKWKELVK